VGTSLLAQLRPLRESAVDTAQELLATEPVRVQMGANVIVNLAPFHSFRFFVYKDTSTVNHSVVVVQFWNRSGDDQHLVRLCTSSSSFVGGAMVAMAGAQAIYPREISCF